MKRLLFLVPLMFLAGCATMETQQVSTGPHGECLVCKANADLACVDIPITAETPHADYNGKTYYFCSDDCRNTFLKNPAKYAALAHP
jgi:YHS domain-containing protein